MLKPDANMRLLRAYHTSAKWLIPQGLWVWWFSGWDSPLTTALQASTVANMGFHSYVSASAIVTDYIKHPRLETVARVSNLKLHGFATVGLLYWIIK